jgi:alkylation response protein AidB-like acyl-CoA dehydrogenase
LPEETHGLREEVREFLAKEMKDFPAVTRAQTWMGFDGDFSKKMGDRGWIGMRWSKKYGGHERSAFDRYVVLEELLAAGAPVGAHWIGDRQSGPLLLNFGTEEQRQLILPKVAKSECFLCIGMSEPDSGSDLAATRTKAEKVEGGYRVNGTKLWTSNAHKAHYMIALFRTDPEKKHDGLTQFLVDLSLPGITIRPIKDLAGNSHFNEVVFEDVFVPDTMLVGQEGTGWAQVTAELAFERSGPERYLSSYC